MATARYPVRLQIGDGAPHEIGTWEITAHTEAGHVEIAAADIAAMLREVADEITSDPALNAAYRERARLVAYLAYGFPSVVAAAPDVDEPGWHIVYLRTPAGQMSWHIAPSDLDLFDHVERVDPADPFARWDGHTTDEKYERLAALTCRG